MPGGIIWESDVSNMSVIKAGEKYSVKDFLKKFGEPELGTKVRVYYSNKNSSDTRGAFMSMELR
jgi:hypothetical protein